MSEPSQRIGPTTRGESTHERGVLGEVLVDRSEHLVGVLGAAQLAHDTADVGRRVVHLCVVCTWSDR